MNLRRQHDGGTSARGGEGRRRAYLGLAGPEVATDVAVVPLLVGVGHEHLDVLADHFNEREAEQLRGGLVEAVNGGLFVDDDGRDEQIVDHLALLLKNRLVTLLLLDDGTQDAGEELVALQTLLRHAQVDGCDRTVLHLRDHVSARADDLGVAGAHVVRQVPVVLIAERTARS